MTNKRCFLITAYCDNPEKALALKTCLTQLQKYDIDIILFSHYPIEEDIYNLTSHAIYDYSNPIIEFDGSRSMVNFMRRNLDDIPLKFNTHSFDYGFAAAQQIKRGLLYVNDIGYDEAFVINYDLIIPDGFMGELDNLLKNHDSIVLNYGEGQRELDIAGRFPNRIYMALFALKIKPFINNLKSINLEDYNNKVGDDIVEGYLYPLFLNENSIEIARKDWEGNQDNRKIHTSMVMEGDVLSNFKKPDYSWFLGHEIQYIGDKRVDNNHQLFMLWDINKDLNVEICIDGKVVNTSFIPKKNGYHTIQLPIEHSQLYVLKDKIKITINGWIIPEGEIKKNLKSSIEACYNE